MIWGDLVIWHDGIKLLEKSRVRLKQGPWVFMGASWTDCAGPCLPVCVCVPICWIGLPRIGVGVGLQHQDCMKRCPGCV